MGACSHAGPGSFAYVAGQSSRRALSRPGDAGVVFRLGRVDDHHVIVAGDPGYAAVQLAGGQRHDPGPGRSAAIGRQAGRAAARVPSGAIAARAWPLPWPRPRSPPARPGSTSPALQRHRRARTMQYYRIYGITAAVPGRPGPVTMRRPRHEHAFRRLASGARAAAARRDSPRLVTCRHRAAKQHFPQRGGQHRASCGTPGEITHSLWTAVEINHNRATDAN